MPNSPALKSALALAAMDLQAPLIQDTLLEDRQFREEYSIGVDGVLSVGETCFNCSVLYGAVRRALSGGHLEEITDRDGQEWKVESAGQGEELPRFLLHREAQRLALPVEFAGLSADRRTRLDLLDKAGADVNLPRDSCELWRRILHRRPLDDHEVEHLRVDRLDTPMGRSSAIGLEIEGGEGSPSTLVPPSRRYFERLVGKYDGSSCIGDYAGGGGKSLLEELAAWRPVEGFLLSLLLSSHSSLPDQIGVDHIDADDLLGAFDCLARSGDRLSQLGAIEVGFRILGARPEVEEALGRLVQEIREEGAEGQTSGYALLSALFGLVNGEVSRMRLFRSEPPFYRRLAALSQAALIYRQLVELRVDFNHFIDWALGWPQWHYVQSLADMRVDPRWNPEYGAESLIKADFLGRVSIAGSRFEENLKGTALYDMVFGDDPSSVQSLIHPVHSFLAGPLEGAEGGGIDLPSGLPEKIEADLKAEEVGMPELISIGTLALIFRIQPKQARLAGDVLKGATYRLADLEDKQQLVAAVMGLATVAAVSRSPELADHLRILCRRYRRDKEHTLGIQEALVVCLVAAASHPGLEEWTEYVGDWVTELAFGELEDEEARIVNTYLTSLCHVVPELWISGGQADAALKAFMGQ